jgi:hypothetical protein
VFDQRRGDGHQAEYAARREAAERAIDQVRNAGGIDDEDRPARRDRADRPGDVVFALRIDAVHRAEGPGQLQPAINPINNDDLEQPQIAAPRTAARPTAPAPRTAIAEPGGGFRPFITVPAPVWMQQPSGPRILSGTSFGILTVFRSPAKAK